MPTFIEHFFPYQGVGGHSFGNSQMLNADLSGVAEQLMFSGVSIMFVAGRVEMTEFSIVNQFIVSMNMDEG